MLRDTASLAAVRAAGRPTDEDLVAAVREGDDRAFERLYGRYHRRIAAFVNGMVQDHARSEDITQEVFVSALRRMRDTDRPINFKPWVYEIAKNASIDAFRRNRRADLVSIDVDDDGVDALEGRRLAGREPTPDAAVDTKLQLETLQGAFGGLSDAHHEILVMRELEGLSYKEIGDRLGMTRPSVESTLFRARRRLEEEFEEIASGERCRRVQATIAGGADARLGLRDEKRMARHVSHCQPCRRDAALAGFDVAALSRTPLRKRIAGVLPLPVILRRWVGGDGPLPLGAAAQYAEPVGGVWVKAAAAAAALALTAGGLGAATDRAPAKVGAGKAQRAAEVQHAARGTGAGTPAPRAATATSSRATAATGSQIAQAGSVKGAGPSGQRRAGSGDAAAGTSKGKGAAAKASKNGDRPVASSPAGTTTGPVRQTVKQITAATGGATKPVRTGTMPKVKSTVGSAVKGVTGTVGALTGTTAPSGGAGSGSAGPVSSAVGTVTSTAGGAVGAVTGAAASATAPAAGGSSPSTSDPGTLGKVSGAVSGLLGGGR